MTLGIRLVQERSEGWTTFVKVTPLSGAIYFIAKMIGQSMIHVFSIVVIFIAGVLINGVSLSIHGTKDIAEAKTLYHRYLG